MITIVQPKNINIMKKYNINNIEDNAEFIYNSITRLDNVTIYIPKIYQK